MEYAYNSEDLDGNLVLGEAGYRGICNLDNDIHPIWKRENFRVGDIEEQVRMLEMNDVSWDRSTLPLDPKIYQRMKPGLRFASLLLGQSGPFFSQVMHGELQPRQVRRLHPLGDLNEWKLRWVNVLGKPNFHQRVIAAQLENFAENVAANSLIYFPGDTAVDYSWGVTHTALDERCRYAIGIGSLLADVICQPQWHKISAQNRRYHNFQLAITLVHELAHVAWICRCWADLLQDPDAATEEAVLSPDEEQIELGQSWENWFFGGDFQPIETAETPPRWLGFSFGPFTRDSGNSESLNYQDCRYGVTAIPAFCINQFFQKERWAAHKDGTDPFSIHLTPLNSLSNEHWQDKLDDGFMTRMRLNHGSQTNPRRTFPEAG